MQFGHQFLYGRCVAQWRSNSSGEGVYVVVIVKSSSVSLSLSRCLSSLSLKPTISASSGGATTCDGLTGAVLLLETCRRTSEFAAPVGCAVRDNSTDHEELLLMQNINRVPCTSKYADLLPPVLASIHQGAPHFRVCKCAAPRTRGHRCLACSHAESMQSCRDILIHKVVSASSPIPSSSH